MCRGCFEDPRGKESKMETKDLSGRKLGWDTRGGTGRRKE